MTEKKSDRTKIEKITDCRALTVNPNLHTQRGMETLKRAMSEVGYVAPMTVAADGEALDGSARLEIASEEFEAEAIIVEHDGQRPVIMVRTDIPNARTEEARKIIYGANRIAELNLDWDYVVLSTETDSVDFSAFWTEEEIEHLSVEAYGDTSTLRDGQDVQSTWAQLRESTACQVKIGEIETRLTAQTAERLKNHLLDRYENFDRPIHESFEIVILEGLEIVEDRDPGL